MKWVIVALPLVGALCYLTGVWLIVRQSPDRAMSLAREQRVLFQLCVCASIACATIGLLAKAIESDTTTFLTWLTTSLVLASVLLGVKRQRSLPLVH